MRKRFEAALESTPRRRTQPPLVGRSITKFGLGLHPPPFKGIGSGQDEAYVDLVWAVDHQRPYEVAGLNDRLILFSDEFDPGGWQVASAGYWPFLTNGGPESCRNFVESPQSEPPRADHQLRPPPSVICGN